MRTLIVDNYDSFAYNLFHYLAEVSGVEPIVIKNDDPRWDPELLREVDNVVISPGPGTPERPADFGVCGEIVVNSRIPVLGVCLGHQGIACLSGARIVRAPEPIHGRISAVHHDGRELFEGMDSPFDAVRYHSLAVTDLPEDLVATAWTGDGVLMALRHRERPLWGVQFHPESVSTVAGHRLLGNFNRLTAEWRRGHAARRVHVAGTGVASRARSVGEATDIEERRYQVLVERHATRWNDEVVFDTLFGASETAFWLDSSAPGNPNGRFSILGDASGPLSRVVTASVSEHTVVTTRSDGSLDVDGGGFFTWLDRDLRVLRVSSPRLPFDFELGWVGYLGYELKAECGGAAAHRSPHPDAAMVFASRAVVLDHQTSTTYLLALCPLDADHDEHAESQRAWLAETATRLCQVAGASPQPAPEPLGPAQLSLRHSREQYLKLIDQCQQAIASGESYEICLTNMAQLDQAIDPWTAYRYLRRFSPAPFGAFLRFGTLAVLSTSPERFLRIDSLGVAQSKPIKGTRPRGRTESEDDELRRGLATSEKDRAENLMIVDLVRNDLGRCAEVGSVHVTRLFDVESYATVHQLVSTVEARLRPECSAVDCVRAAFPGGSMTGAPKTRTMRLIDEWEAGPRGVYSGAIGYFSCNGAADLSIVIRTVVSDAGTVSYGIGGAIVALSDADDEYEETAVKCAPLLSLVQGRFPGRHGIGAVGAAEGQD